ncbi:hypothetical protein GCM10009624_07000 [Gordonia sinesedis]
MTTAAVVLLVVTALVPAIPALVRHRLSGSSDTATGTARRVDLVTAVLLVLLAAVAAGLAARAGEAVRGATAGVVICAAVVAAIAGGGFVVRTVLAAGGVPGAGVDTGVDGADTPSDSAPATAQQPLRGGRVIGYLERAAVAVTLLIGWPEGLAVILAVKSLARYPELRAPHASEQFIMGTFASVLWACALAGIGHLLLR